MTESPDNGHGVGGIMLRGTALMVAMRWGMRLTGFLSTIVLARLLVPEDFGIVAMAAALMALVESFVNLGVDMALIQDRQAGRAEYDTAWTIRIGQSVLIAILLVAGSPLAADFYGEPRVEPVMWAIAAVMLVRGAENIGAVDFRRDLKFGKEFFFQFSGKVGQAVTAVTFAFIIQSHWALVLGITAGAVIRLCLSYVMSKYRPGLSLLAFGKLWSFSQWMLLYNLGTMLGAQGNRILVGGFAPTSVMGAYTVGTDLGHMPSMELRAPVERTIGPGLASVKSEPERAIGGALKGIGLMALLVLPAGFGTFAVAREFVVLVLGQKWTAAIPFVEVGALGGAFAAMTAIPSAYLLVSGYVRSAAVIRTAWAIAIIGLAYPILTMYDVIGYAYFLLLVNVFSLCVFAWTMSRRGNVALRRTLSQLVRPLSASIAMAGGVRYFLNETVMAPLMALPAAVVAGVVLYAAVLLGAWVVVGRPAGAERTVMKLGLDRLKSSAL